VKKRANFPNFWNLTNSRNSKTPKKINIATPRASQSYCWKHKVKIFKAVRKRGHL
jgi:hypothetical protein